MNNILKASTLVACSALFATGAASAGPVLDMAEMYAAPGTFFLNNSESHDVVQYTNPRNLEVCIPAVAQPSPTSGRRASEVPLKLSWDGNTTMVYPGNCFYFDARRVTVSPGGHVPQGEVIQGTIRPRD